MNLDVKNNKLHPINYRLIFEKVPGLFLLLSPDLYILDASDEYCAATLTKRDSIIDKHLFEVFPDNPDDPYATGVANLKSSLDVVKRTLMPDAMAVQKYDVKNEDGIFEEKSWSPINVPVLDDNNQLLYIIHRAEDVTDLIEDQKKFEKQDSLIQDLKEQLKALDIYKRAQQIQTSNKTLREEVEKSNLAYEDLFNAVPVSIIGIDNEGIIRFSNKKFHEMFDVKSAMTVPQSIEEFIVPIDIKKNTSNLISSIQNLSKESTKNIQTNFIGRRTNGALFPFQININASQIKNQQIYLLSIEDISLRVQIETKINNYIKNIENKNKELEQFTYIASHDLQEPLRSITSFIELLHMEYSEHYDENAELYFNFILKSTSRMRDLIKGLLDYSRIGNELEIQPENSQEILEQVIEDLNDRIHELNAVVTYEELPVVQVSKLHFRILLQNLISNALKFHKKDISPKVEISAIHQNNKWQFCIKDNGIGIDQQYKEKIFTIFQRLHTRDAYEGTGIGLAHCQKIIQLHNGEIWFESEFGQGTSFYFTILDKI